MYARSLLSQLTLGGRAGMTGMVGLAFKPTQALAALSARTGLIFNSTTAPMAAAAACKVLAVMFAPGFSMLW